jgi:FkbM family methyltransferase
VLSPTSLAGKIARLPLALVPRESIVPILRGELKGQRWIVGSGIHRCWLGFYEHEKQQRISEAVQPNTVFYDVGANVGFYTLLGSLLVGAGKVFAFEPLLHNIEYLRKHLALNRVQNVEVLELAIADENGDALFEVESTGSMGHLSHGGAVKVQTATLDFLLEQGRILPPNYIKMDIEGAELAALRGAQRCIQQYRPQIFLATHGQEIHSQCCRLLESWGFECQIAEFTANGFGELVATPKH